jgi:hypothetical protein
VQQAMARSQAAGRAATTNAASMFAGTGTPNAIQGRILNRIARVGEQNTAGIAPTYAATLAAKAPAAIFGAADAQAGMSGIQMQGEASGLQAAQTRAQGWANAASSIASSAGYAAANSPWLEKYFSSKEPVNSAAGPYRSGYRYSA